MRAFILPALLAVLTACSGSDHGIIDPITGKPKPDPFVTVRVRHMMDTTTAPGRAHWHLYVLLSGPYPEQNGTAPQGAISLQDVRLHHDVLCMKVAADSVGQRLISPIAVADTTTAGLTADAEADAIISAWYAGNHTLPSGWMALVVPPTDAWDSQQYAAGHGLVRSDPIKWSFDWTASGSTSFYERTDSDPICATY